MASSSSVKTLVGGGAPADSMADWLSPLPDLEANGISADASSPITIGAGTALTDVLYLTEPGDRSAISVDDIHQGQIGDCFLLSSIGELALYDPAAIQSMIGVGPGGAEAVKLFESPNGSVPTFGATRFTQMTESVTNSFPGNSVNNGETQDVVGSQKEIWVQVLEKAHAEANGGYAGIQNGGNPCIALQQLTGHTAQWESPLQATAAQLTADVKADDLIVMDTANSNFLPYNLVGDHAYMFEGLTTVGGTTYAQLGNPWGFDQPALIPVSQLSRGIVEVDIGHFK